MSPSHHDLNESTQFLEIEPWEPGEAPVLKMGGKPMTAQEALRLGYSPHFLEARYGVFDSIIVVNPSPDPNKRRWFLTNLNVS